MNYYDILGVGPDATDQVIKGAYRREAMKWHPDRHDGAAAKREADRRFKELAVAYRTLRDPKARANYDRQLEQQLHREYEARQREQERQQRTHSEQARQKQARPEEHKANFQDTQPEFAEETASADDANQMFYEQMLDLAFELAGRGFPEFNILKALIALGCPEALAKAVAAKAAKQGFSKRTDDAVDKRDGTPLSNFDEASFEEMEPYYVAAIMGAEPLKPISNERYDAILALRKRRDKFWLGLVVVTLLSGLFALLAFKKSDIFAAAAGLAMVFIVLWIIFRNLFIGSDKSRFRAEETKRYYLGCFRSLHNEKIGSMSRNNKTLRLTGFKYQGLNGGAFVASFGWLGYRRLPVLAYTWAAIYAAMAYAIGFAESVGNFKWPSGISMGIAAGFSVYANRLYFNKVRSNILIAIDETTHNHALTYLRKAGGTNSLGWILPWIFFIILCIPLGIMLEEDTAAQTQKAQAQRAALVASDLVASQANQRATDQPTDSQAEAEYNRTLSGIESKYPQLNPDSPYYNAAATQWVAERKKLYDQGGGRSRSVSLQQAVTDYATALQQNQENRPNVVTATAPPVNAYISYVKGLSMRDRNFQVIADMGVKFPTLSGYLSYVKGDFKPKHFDQANLVELTQTWGFNRTHGPQGGFIVFQNRTYQALKGITVEIQTEERPCDQKGSVYFMTLEFARSVPPASVVGIDFQFPNAIPNANRCMDVVDLIFG